MEFPKVKRSTTSIPFSRSNRKFSFLGIRCFHGWEGGTPWSSTTVNTAGISSLFAGAASTFTSMCCESF